MRMNKGLSHSAETVPSPAKLAAATAVPFTSLLVRSAPITSLIMTQLFLEVSLSLLVPPPYPTSLHFPVQAMMRQGGRGCNAARTRARSEEHTSELQSLMSTSYAVFCLKRNTLINYKHYNYQPK